jgi:hypothetical protein
MENRIYVTIYDENRKSVWSDYMYHVPRKGDEIRSGVITRVIWFPNVNEVDLHVETR